MKRILFFINVHSGTGTPEDLEKEIDKLSAIYDFEYRIVELAEADTSVKIRKALEDFSPDVAVAGGGDGTVNLIASAIIDRPVALGIIPLGSSNGMAYELTISDDPAKALKTVVEGEPGKIDALLIDNENVCLHLSDLGMNARVIRRYEHQRIRGFLGYAMQYFRELKNRRKFRFTVQTDKETYRSKAVMIVMANAAHYGTGASITPDGKPDDGWFEVVAVKAYPFWFLFYMAISIIMRNFSHNRFRKIMRCREAEIAVESSQELQIDGEPEGRTSRVSVKILPGSLSVIRP